MHDNNLMETGLRGNAVDIRPCSCGSIHLSFFGRTTFHLSHEEFLDFSRGVAKATAQLEQSHKDDGISVLQNSTMSH